MIKLDTIRITTRYLLKYREKGRSMRTRIGKSMLDLRKKIVRKSNSVEVKGYR